MLKLNIFIFVINVPTQQQKNQMYTHHILKVTLLFEHTTFIWTASFYFMFTLYICSSFVCFTYRICWSLFCVLIFFVFTRLFDSSRNTCWIMSFVNLIKYSSCMNIWMKKSTLPPISLLLVILLSITACCMPVLFIFFFTNIYSFMYTFIIFGAWFYTFIIFINDVWTVSIFNEKEDWHCKY